MNINKCIGIPADFRHVNDADWVPNISLPIPTDDSVNADSPTGTSNSNRYGVAVRYKPSYKKRKLFVEDEDDMVEDDMVVEHEKEVEE